MKISKTILLYYNRIMNFDIYDLEDAVQTKLEWIDAINYVYDSFVLKSEWYPYAAFECSGGESDFADVCSNFTTVTFNIVILCNISKDLPRPESKRVLYTILNQVKNDFDKDFSLSSWQVIKKDALSWDFWTFLWKEWDLLALTIALRLQVNNEAVNFVW